MLSAASSTAFADLAFTLASRISIPEEKTSPEELLAAAHGGCFTMSLATELSKAGTPPTSLETRITVTMDEVEGKGHQIVHSQIEVSIRALEEVIRVEQSESEDELRAESRVEVMA